MDLKIKGKTALVIASSDGLGKAIAQELANEGANVMLASRSRDKLIKAKEEIEQTALGKVSYVEMDQTKISSIHHAIEQTHNTFGSISILVNNSGGPNTGTFDSLGENDWQSAYELTLLSYIRIIRAVLPDLRKNHGRILNNASSSIKEPIAGITLSNVFRMGILGLSKTLSQELAEYHILVNTIGAGIFNTDRLKNLQKSPKSNTDKNRSENTSEAQFNHVPLGLYGEPEEFAKVAAFLVSDANTYMTGQSILVDGGLVKAI